MTARERQGAGTGKEAIGKLFSGVSRGMCVCVCVCAGLGMGRKEEEVRNATQDLLRGWGHAGRKRREGNKVKMADCMTITFVCGKVDQRNGSERIEGEGSDPLKRTGPREAGEEEECSHLGQEVSGSSVEGLCC